MSHKPIVFDSEIFPNFYCLCAIDLATNQKLSWEISTRRNELRSLIDQMRNWTHREMVGFNNIAFDYPLLHFIVTSRINEARAIYQRALAMIDAPDAQKWQYRIKPSEEWVRQIDLFKIHHFDNKARMTSLKALEFNMRMTNISDLPFPPGTFLSHAEMEKVKDYCWDDVAATDLFLVESQEKIDFRRSMSEMMDFDFVNCSDVKIGKQVFQIELEKAGVHCYDYSPDTGRTPRQTPRPTVFLGDCIPEWVQFGSKPFKDVHETLKNMTITQTKDAFSLVACAGGLEFFYGTGGIHASVDQRSFVASDTHMIYDVDVTSLYPSIAIENGYYPEHLGPTFVEVYRRLRERRVSFKKGTPENAALKLALNGVYGDSNSPFSVFYDPKFTMSITLTGQMILSMLIEWLIAVPDVEIVQANTDGITMYMPRSMKPAVDFACAMWEMETRMTLESVEYTKMFIADVNNYIAVDTNGKVKRKGRYEYDVEWHQNASALVVKKVAEKVLLDEAPIRETVENWPDLFDFMMRVKVPRSSKLMIKTDHGEYQMENTQRYYIAKSGGELIKIMPPLAKNPGVYRRIGINSGYKVCPCNNILHAKSEIDFSWYINEVEKLVLEVM